MAEQAIALFYKDMFQIEEFLTNSEEKQELKDVLRSLMELKLKNSKKMTSVLKEQTDTVISIGEDVQQVYKMIGGVECPTSQLRDQIKLLQYRVNCGLFNYNEYAQLDSCVKMASFNISCIKAFRVIIKHTGKLIAKYIGLINGEADELDRLTSQFAFHSNMLLTLRGFPKPGYNSEEVDGSVYFLMKDKFLSSFKNHGINDLRRLIDMFIFLKKVELLIEIIRVAIIEPLLLPILNETHLRECGHNLKQLYNNALSVLDQDLKILNMIVKYDNIREFSLVIDCYWYVADNLLRMSLNSITAAGNADIFFKSFQETHEYLDYIVKSQGDEKLVRDYPSMISHLKRFNLLVYYEIRHQEVSSNFEVGILRNCKAETEFLHNPAKEISSLYFKCTVSSLLYHHVQYIFHKMVFLPIISDQFLKTFLMTMSRYINWVQEMTACNDKEPETQKYHLICVLNDLVFIKSQFGFKIKDLSRLDKSVFAIVDKSVRKELRDVLKLINQQSNAQIRTVEKKYVELAKADMIAQLQSVSSLPRLYRRTNKTTPSEPSEYVVKAMEPVITFQKYFENEPKLARDIQNSIIDEVISSSASDYLLMIKDVLASVCKTEESLRRLKFRTSNGDEGRPDNNTDEYKIRLQIKLDAEYFTGKLFSHALAGGKESLDQLLQAIAE